MIGVIKGTGSAIPKKVIDNNQLAQIVDTSDEWIRERTGIIRRHIAEEETTVSMAAEAGKQALLDAKIEAEAVDMIIVATISSNVIMPSTACEVQRLIGAKNATCFDLNSACTGFLFAYTTAQSYIALGVAKTVLVIGSESLSNLLDWNDRGTCVLFGDGAGAAVLEAENGDVAPMVLYSDGEKGVALTCESRHQKNTIEENTFLKMDGQAVFKFVARKIPSCIEELLDKKGMAAEEIDLFILHQANKRMIETVAKRLKIDADKIPVNLMEYGNTSSASIPILLDELNKQGKLKPGMKLIMSGYGAGLSWGATYLEWK